MAIILDGKATAAIIKAELAVRVKQLSAKGITPGLGTVLVGDDPGSHSYVGGKHRDCAEVGIESIRIDLPATASQDEVEARFAHCVDLLEPGGKFYLRANPGIAHKTGPYVEIFPWTFETVNEFADTYGLKLLTFKRDANNRLYFVYQKPGP